MRQILGLLFFLLFTSSFSNEFIFEEEEDATELLNHIEYSKVPGTPITISDIIFNNLDFTPLNKTLIHSSPFKGQYIFKYTINNPSKKQNSLIFTIENPFLDDILFIESKQNEIFQIQEVGLDFPFARRKIRDYNYTFEIKVPAHDSRTFYFRISNKNDFIRIPISIKTFYNFHNQEVVNFTSITFYYGILLFALIFAITFYFTLRKIVFIWFSLYIFFTTALLLNSDGISFQYFWPASPEWAKISSYLFFTLAHIFLLKLVSEYRLYYDKIISNSSFVKYLRLSFIIGLFISIIFYEYTIVLKSIFATLSVATQTFIICKFVENSEKTTHAKIFTWVQIGVLTGFILTILFQSGILVDWYIFNQASKIMISVQVVGLTIALSESLRNLLSKSKDKLEFEIKLRTIEIEAQKDFLYVQKEQIQNQNKQHEQSLRYAKNIQLAILPSRDEMQHIFSPFLLFYKPKDIVSGDFYWATQIKHKKIIVCADCTGHGIPGAFLSILAISSLKTIINTMNITSSHSILNELRAMIIQALSQKNGNSQIKDGMDISLCILDTKTNMLEYSGAYNPLYIMRNSSLIQLKTDNMPVGNFVHTNSFTQNHIQLEKKDRVYMFTDGYADQIGGEFNKKMKRSVFRKLLTDIQKHPLNKQEKILRDFFAKWQNGYEQIDDVTILGFEIH